jgi:hypothetical protein
VNTLSSRFALSPDEAKQVRSGWTSRVTRFRRPEADSREHRRLFVDSVRAIISGSKIDPEERANWSSYERR